MKRYIVKEVFDQFLISRRFKTVAEHLNAEGHRTENDALFTGQSVSRILRDQTHLENEIISQELWGEVQTILSARSRSGGAKRRVGAFLAIGNQARAVETAQGYFAQVTFQRIQDRLLGSPDRFADFPQVIDVHVNQMGKGFQLRRGRC